MAEKSGRLNSQEIAYIRQNCDKMTDEELAKQLGRGLNTIVRCRKKLGVLKKGGGRILSVSESAASGSDNFEHMTEAEKLAYCRRKIMGSQSYALLQEEFNDKEMVFFVHQYTHYYIELRAQSDITSVEETQIMQLCRYEVMMHNIRSLEKINSQDLADMQQEYNDQLALSPELRDRVRMNDLMTIMTAIRATSSARSKELLELQKQHSKLLQDLKATRNQRLQSIENRTQNFADLVKYLRKIENQEAEAREMELSRLALQEHIKKYGELHKFMDDTYDKILISDETV